MYGKWNNKDTPEKLQRQAADHAWTMDKIGFVVLVLVALALAGCATNGDRCQNYGLNPGTGAYNQCVDQLNFNDHLTAQQNLLALQQNNQRIQNQLMNVSHPYGY